MVISEVPEINFNCLIDIWNKEKFYIRPWYELPFQGCSGSVHLSGNFLTFKEWRRVKIGSGEWRWTKRDRKITFQPLLAFPTALSPICTSHPIQQGASPSAKMVLVSMDATNNFENSLNTFSLPLMIIKFILRKTLKIIKN